MINSGNGYKNVWRPWPLHLGIGYAQLCEHAIKFVYTRQNLLCMQVLELNIDSMWVGTLWYSIIYLGTFPDM